MFKLTLSLISTALLALAPTAASPADGSNSAEADRGTTSIGERKFCADCPIFIRVPDAPDPLRPIRYVSKFELTWNNYLAAVDAGSCPVPDPYRPGFDAERLQATRGDVANHLDYFRVDWAIGILSVSNVKCYVTWLQQFTDLEVVLPSAREWEWFALAGRNGAGFPWGNEPDGTKEALLAAAIPDSAESPWEYRHDGKETIRHIHGVKVGQFPPNDWGLYDIVGNLRELTSDLKSGEEMLRRNPNSHTSRAWRDKWRAVLKGSELSYSTEWSPEKVQDEKYAVLFGERYSTSVAIRLVLVERSPQSGERGAH